MLGGLDAPFRALRIRAGRRRALHDKASIPRLGVAPCDLNWSERSCLPLRPGSACLLGILGKSLVGQFPGAAFRPAWQVRPPGWRRRTHIAQISWKRCCASLHAAMSPATLPVAHSLEATDGGIHQVPASLAPHQRAQAARVRHARHFAWFPGTILPGPFAVFQAECASFWRRKPPLRRSADSPEHSSEAPGSRYVALVPAVHFQWLVAGTCRFLPAAQDALPAALTPRASGEAALRARHRIPERSPRSPPEGVSGRNRPFAPGL